MDTGNSSLTKSDEEWLEDFLEPPVRARPHSTMMDNVDMETVEMTLSDEEWLADYENLAITKHAKSYKHSRSDEAWKNHSNKVYEAWWNDDKENCGKKHGEKTWQNDGKKNHRLQQPRERKKQASAVWKQIAILRKHMLKDKKAKNTQQKTKNTTKNDKEIHGKQKAWWDEDTENHGKNEHGEKAWWNDNTENHGKNEHGEKAWWDEDTENHGKNEHGEKAWWNEGEKNQRKKEHGEKAWWHHDKESHGKKRRGKKDHILRQPGQCKQESALERRQIALLDYILSAAKVENKDKKKKQTTKNDKEHKQTADVKKIKNKEDDKTHMVVMPQPPMVVPPPQHMLAKKEKAMLQAAQSKSKPTRPKPKPLCSSILNSCELERA